MFILWYLIWSVLDALHIRQIHFICLAISLLLLWTYFPCYTTIFAINWYDQIMVFSWCTNHKVFWILFIWNKYIHFLYCTFLITPMLLWTYFPCYTIVLLHSLLSIASDICLNYGIWFVYKPQSVLDALHIICNLQPALCPPASLVNPGHAVHIVDWPYVITSKYNTISRSTLKVCNQIGLEPRTKRRMWFY